MYENGVGVSYQAFPEHWLAQLPVPDQSSALGLQGFGSHQPLEPMLQAMGKLAALGATSVAVVCNTAHAWHGELQERFPQLEVLHIAREVAQTLAHRGVRKVGLLATVGTYRAALYEQALAEFGVRCFIPQAGERDELMHGIYQGVKVGNLNLARKCFTRVAATLVCRFSLTTLILGCTEIPLALSQLPGLEPLELVDPAFVLAKALAQRAYSVVRS